MRFVFKHLIGFLFFVFSFLLHAQPDNSLPKGTYKSQYGFVNQCKSFIKWDVTPKNLGSTFGFDFNNLKNKTFCPYLGPPSGYEYFHGKVEFITDMKFHINGHSNMMVNFTPGKIHRFYLKDNFEYLFQDWSSYFGTYSDAQWKIENQKKAASRTDSIFFLKTRKPSFGDYLALLYFEYGSEVDFDVPKISEYLTGDKKHLREFYEDYIGKPYDYLNRAFNNEEEHVEFDPSLIVEEYLNISNERNSFLAISLFFDEYYKFTFKKDQSKNIEDIILNVYNYLNPRSRSYSYDFDPQYLIDKYDGVLEFKFRNEFISLEIKNKDIVGSDNYFQPLSAIVRADITYQNLPYEKIDLNNEKNIHLDSFFLGNGIIKVKPHSYSIWLDKFKYDYDLGYISSFHQNYDRSSFPFQVHSDDYIKSFMGLYIKNAIITLKIKGKEYEFENARLLLDGNEINGTIDIDFSIFKGAINIKELGNQFNLHGIEIDIPENRPNSKWVQVFFRIK